MPTVITFIFRKFEGYIPSGIGARSVPVSRQAGMLADENIISFEIFKILWWAKLLLLLLLITVQTSMRSIMRNIPLQITNYTRTENYSNCLNL